VSWIFLTPRILEILSLELPAAQGITFFDGNYGIGMDSGDMALWGATSAGVSIKAAGSLGSRFNGALLARFKAGEILFNDDAGDIDFRVKGDTDTNLFFVDASTDSIGIGESTPTAILHLDTDITTGVDIFKITDGGAASLIYRDQGGGSVSTLTTVTADYVAGLQVRGVTAESFTLLGNEASTATNPTVIPNRDDITSGMGGISGEVSLITGGIQAINIDASQNIIMGTGSPNNRLTVGGDMDIVNNNGFILGHPNFITLSNGFGGSQIPEFQILGTGAPDSSMGIFRTTASSGGAKSIFTKSRNSAIGSFTIVQDGDQIGTIIFSGDDGVDYQSTAAEIEVMIDGTPGVGDMPGKLIFKTTADGAQAPTIRMTIKSDGNTGIGTETPSTTLEVNGTVSYTPSATQNITAAGGITVTNGIMRVQGNAAPITVTATPNIVDGFDGQIVIIQGDNSTNTLELQDQANLANSGLELSGNINFTLEKGSTLQLIYDGGDDLWYEISRSDNV